MKIGIYTNLTKDADLETTRRVVTLLKKNNAEYYLFENVKDILTGENYFFKNNYSFIELMITIGGDGTVLNLAKDCMRYNIPILTINKGTKGFLNEVEPDEIDRIMEIINGQYKVDKRQLISIRVGGKKFYALNEAYITRSSAAKMIMLDAKIEGILIERFFCDGLVIATPTGSTAYSLSAGGPVISPKAEVTCLTPVCPHSLHSRPIIVDCKEQLEISMGQNYDDAVLMVDGIELCDIRPTDTVVVQRSHKFINFLRFSESSFYIKLLDRLNRLL